MGVARCSAIDAGLVSFSTNSTFFTFAVFAGGILEILVRPCSSVHLKMSPQAFAGMKSDINAGSRANNQNGLRKCANATAVLDVSDMCEVITKTGSPVKPTKKL